MMNLRIPKIFNFVLFSALMLMVFSCTKAPEYFEYQNIDHAEWYSDSTLVFETSIQDSRKIYQMDIYLRHGLKYEYKNLWLKVEMQSPDGLVESKKIELELTDNKGLWKGTSISSLVDYKALFDNQLVLGDTGTYIWRFSHLMSDTVLYQINDIGMSLSRIK